MALAPEKLRNQIVKMVAIYFETWKHLATPTFAKLNHNVSLGVCSFNVYARQRCIIQFWFPVSTFVVVHSKNLHWNFFTRASLSASWFSFIVQCLTWLTFYHSVFSNPGHESSGGGGDPTNVEVAASPRRETCQTSGRSDWPAGQCGIANAESRGWSGIHGWGTGRLLGFGQDV